MTWQTILVVLVSVGVWAVFAWASHRWVFRDTVWGKHGRLARAERRLERAAEAYERELRRWRRT